MEDKNTETKKTTSSEEIDNTDPKLRKEIDVDTEGNKTVVDRAREEDATDEGILNDADPDNPNINRGVTTEKEAMKTVENKDLNSDITPNRYPNSKSENRPDNKKSEE
ncbi:hypothetical protein ABS764_01120 [Flavobacterium sp. ST-87]|uniref:Uncharacterized protein n=1 Tax=Flavobacterium plantiphilum TaxID=3163297 RepID=A0ABW8XNE9_9FLAO